MALQSFMGIAFEIACVIFLGFILKKTKIVTAEVQKGISQMLLLAILPVSILESALEPMEKPSAAMLTEASVLIAAYYFAAIFIARGISRRHIAGERKQRLFVNLSTFANVGFIGFALCQALLGAEATIYAVIYNLEYQIFLVLYAIPGISGNRRMDVKAIFADPMNIASFIAVPLFFVRLAVPQLVLDTLSTVGGMVVPLSMIVIGCQLADVNLRDIVRDRMSLLVSLLRLVIFPCAMLLVVRILRVDSLAASALVLLTALPSGSLNSILAEQYECCPERAAVSVVGSTVLMIATMPVMLALMSAAFA